MCGAHSRTYRDTIIWPELGEEWNLTPEQYELMDQREGCKCPFCGCNWRVRQLAKSLTSDLAGTLGIKATSIARMVSRNAFQGKTIAEINAVAGLHPFLAQIPTLSYSEYGSLDPAVRSENLMRLSYPDASFDYVLTSDTLEHVPDFDLAMSEIWRVLKVGGKHIFNIPIIWGRATRERATQIEGAIHNILPPSYHAGPQPKSEDYLVFNEFGDDVIERVEKAGFKVALKKERSNSLVSTIVAERSI